MPAVLIARLLRKHGLKRHDVFREAPTVLSTLVHKSRRPCLPTYRVTRAIKPGGAYGLPGFRFFDLWATKRVNVSRSSNHVAVDTLR
jgi:hypothetical protein